MIIRKLHRTLLGLNVRRFVVGGIVLATVAATAGIGTFGRSISPSIALNPVATTSNVNTFSHSSAQPSKIYRRLSRIPTFGRRISRLFVLTPSATSISPHAVAATAGHGVFTPSVPSTINLVAVSATAGFSPFAAISISPSIPLHAVSITSGQAPFMLAARSITLVSVSATPGFSLLSSTLSASVALNPVTITAGFNHFVLSSSRRLPAVFATSGFNTFARAISRSIPLIPVAANSRVSVFPNVADLIGVSAHSGLGPFAISHLYVLQPVAAWAYAAQLSGLNISLSSQETIANINDFVVQAMSIEYFAVKIINDLMTISTIIDEDLT